MSYTERRQPENARVRELLATLFERLERLEGEQHETRHDAHELASLVGRISAVIELEARTIDDEMAARARRGDHYREPFRSDN